MARTKRKRTGRKLMRARRKYRSRPNPHGGGMGMLLILGAAGVALYGWYAGWFGGSTTTVVQASTTPQPTTGTTNPVTQPQTQIVNAPVAPPPLGTVVTDANQIAAQATAGMAFILPLQTIPNAASLVPNGYSAINTSDYGTIFLRNNVYQVASTDLNNRIQRAISQGADATSVQNSTQLTLSQIQQDMSSNGIAGLNGWGAVRAWRN